MHYNILKLFGLQGLVLVKIIEHYPSVFLYVIPRRKTGDCPRCSKRNKYLLTEEVYGVKKWQRKAQGVDEERRILQNVFGWGIPRKILLKNKEHLRNIYKLKSRKQAEKRLSSLLKTMWDKKDRGLTQWANTLYRWKDEILNFFDYKITNAYTEGIHTKCKLIKRMSFGFKNKEVYIRKVALACLPLTFLPHFFK